MKKIRLTDWQIDVLLVALGGISCVAFPPYGFFFAFFALFSILLVLLNRTESKKTAFMRAFCVGAGLGMTSMAWVNQALLIDNGAYAWLVPVCVAAMGAFFGLLFAIPAVCSLFFRAGTRRWLAFAAFFTILEWGRSFLLTGFPWNLIGSVWADYPAMLQSASIWGVYGLSFFSILLFSVLALIKKHKKLVILTALTAVLFAVLGLVRLSGASDDKVWGVKLRLVQPNIPQTLKWDERAYEDNFSRLIRLSRQNNEDITHVIWPESSVPFVVNYHESERARLMSAVRQGSYLIMGGLRLVPETNQLANSVFILDDLAGIKGYYDKSHLVPFGEYAPLRSVFPFIGKIVPFENDFYQGEGVKTLMIPKAAPASLLVCYEIIFPHAVVSPKIRPDWIINVTNDGWFGLSAGPAQHYAMAQLRAVEEGIPVVRVANTGISGIINGYGQTLDSLPLGVSGVLDSDLPVALPVTFYGRFGNTLWLAGLILLLFFLHKGQKNRLTK